jgi:broad specificity phosphatase PhoE
MNTLYLVRHGENPANITQEFSYKKVDYSLTAKGVIQAQQTAEFFRSKSIHELYSSPLKRARETAEIIARALNLDVTIIEHFREINVGALEEQPPTRENWTYHDRIIDDWYERRHDSAFHNGEDYWTLLARTRQGLQQILDRKNGRNIVLVGHGGLFAFTLKDICRNVDMGQVRRIANLNCSITEIAARWSGGELEADLRCWAACAHLSGDAATPTPTTRME